MGDKLFEFLNNLTDNDTLIIVFLFVVCLFYNDIEVVKYIATGLLGYMGGKAQA